MKLLLTALLSLALLATPAEAKPGRVGPKLVGKASMPTHVFTRDDRAVLVFVPSNGRRALRRGFKLKRGTRLALGKTPRALTGFYQVMIDDNRHYPRVGAFANTISGHHLRGYVARAAVAAKLTDSGFDRVDQLFTRRETDLVLARGKSFKLARGTWLWAVTGTSLTAPRAKHRSLLGLIRPDPRRYLVRLDDFARYPKETRRGLVGHVDADDVRPPSLLAGATR